MTKNTGETTKPRPPRRKVVATAAVVAPANGVSVTPTTGVITALPNDTIATPETALTSPNDAATVGTGALPASPNDTVTAETVALPASPNDAITAETGALPDATATGDTTISTPDTLVEVGTLPPSVESIRLTVSCAVVSVRTGQTDSIRILARTPAHWRVRDNGSIRETGGPVAEALARELLNKSYSVSNGNVTINGVNVTVPALEDREQMVVEVPAGYQGDLEVNARMFAVVDIEIEANKVFDVESDDFAKVTVKNNQKPAEATLTVSCADATLVTADIVATGNISARVSNKATLTTGRLKTLAGTVTLTADNNGQLRSGIVTGKVVTVISTNNAGIVADSLCSHTNMVLTVDNVSTLTAKHIGARQQVSVSVQNSRVQAGTILALATLLNAKIQGYIGAENCDSMTLNIDASISSTVEIKAGSADNGQAAASISSNVYLTGLFAVRKEQSIASSVTVVRPKPDIDIAFECAGKRYFDRKHWANTHTVLAALVMPGSLATAFKANEELKDAIGDADFLSYFAGGIKAAFKDAMVDHAIVEFGDALKARITEEELAGDSKEKLEAIMVEPEVAAKFQAAFLLFVHAAQQALPK